MTPSQPNGRQQLPATAAAVAESLAPTATKISGSMIACTNQPSFVQTKAYNNGSNVLHNGFITFTHTKAGSATTVASKDSAASVTAANTLKYQITKHRARIFTRLGITIPPVRSSLLILGIDASSSKCCCKYLQTVLAVLCHHHSMLIIVYNLDISKDSKTAETTRQQETAFEQYKDQLYSSATETNDENEPQQHVHLTEELLPRHRILGSCTTATTTTTSANTSNDFVGRLAIIRQFEAKQIGMILLDNTHQNGGTKLKNDLSRFGYNNVVMYGEASTQETTGSAVSSLGSLLI